MQNCLYLYLFKKDRKLRVMHHMRDRQQCYKYSVCVCERERSGFKTVEGLSDTQCVTGHRDTVCVIDHKDTHSV